ncbi:MAG TPA: hypothetical protein VFR15_08420 [Chloroflexia bacterium]|nr:hypothetical protein [Chloroflexia bacterium]
MPTSDETSGASTAPATVLVYCPDVMFASRVQNLARHAGVSAEMVRPGQPIRKGDLLVASFGSGGEWEQMIREATQAGIPTMAFGPHVDGESRRAAKAAGAFRAVNNGNLERALMPVLQELAAGHDVGGALEAVPDAEADSHDH